MPYYKKFSNNPMTTRADFQALVNDLVEPVVPYMEAKGARLDFDEGAAVFGMESSSLEGIARLLWGLAPLSGGGGKTEHWKLVRKILAQGTDPEHPDYWGPTQDHCQHSVEMAAIAVMIMVDPVEGWEAFSSKEQENLLNWLAHIQKVWLVNNNWLFFGVLVQEALKAVGRSDLVDTSVEADYIERVTSWYLGNGWYGDGPTLPVDHYGAFAIHFYSLIYCHFAKDPDPELVALFRTRAEAFMQSFCYWFAENGETLIQGRSLIYRFASAAFWGMAGVCELEGLTQGQIKGMWARQIRCWKDKPIFTADGLLTRGYHYPNLMMCEEYNSPTSPYWAMKAFLPLALSPDAPFWQAEEEPFPFNETLVSNPENKTIVQRIDGHSIVHYGAHVREDVQPDKYNKFAYSTNFGMEVNALQASEDFRFGDNILAFSFDGGINWQMRRKNLNSQVEGTLLLIDWTSGEQQVSTRIEPLEDGLFLRRHVFELNRPALVVESGFAVNQWYEDAEILAPEVEKANPYLLRGNDDIASLLAEEALVAIRGTNGISAMRSVDGLPKFAGAARRTNTNLSAPRTMVPFLLTSLPAGFHTIEHMFGVSPSSASTFLDAFSSRSA